MLKEIISAYFLVMCVVGFAIMGIDKKRAKNAEWRIPEKTLFLIALIGGGIGTTAGMYVFRHKTKHWYFVIGMPLLAALNLVALIYLNRLLVG